MKKMRVVQVSGPNADFQQVERELPEPQSGYVRVKVEACGICHSDFMTKAGVWPGIEYPRIPGHEIAGVVDAIGPGVGGWKTGDRVGVGWHGGHCGYCESCRRGDFVTCQIAGKIPGITTDGGYAEYMIAQAGSLARIPAELSATEAAPLMCAGVTTFNSLRNAGAIAQSTDLEPVCGS
jgi:D-arabinose 1-dehydrogenase-like Zn-dependent alcohol dehydrogenase